ncbi:MAG: hypothetical protein L3J53_02865 [Proteobacteria bacterium]|nr:hypothetical protein [Pseudomonadota bacterium]
MIELTQDVCQELDLIYWQLKPNDEINQVEQPRISREEKELLRKILLAKAVTLDDNLLEIKANGEVIVNLGGYQLIFNDVSIPDTQHIIYLSKLADMANSPKEKKQTWYKLKDLDLQSS